MILSVATIVELPSNMSTMDRIEYLSLIPILPADLFRKGSVHQICISWNVVSPNVHFKDLEWFLRQKLFPLAQNRPYIHFFSIYDHFFWHRTKNSLHRPGYHGHFFDTAYRKINVYLINSPYKRISIIIVLFAIFLIS